MNAPLPSLYVLSEEYRQAAERLSDLELDEQGIKDALGTLTDAIEQKSVNVAMVARNLETTAAAIRDAEEQMARRRKAMENRAAWLRDWLLAGMQNAEITKIEHPMFVISVRDNPPKVDVYAESQIPTEFWRQPTPPAPTIDRKAIGDAIKDGRDVPGARLIRGSRVEVR